MTRVILTAVTVALLSLPGCDWVSVSVCADACDLSGQLMERWSPHGGCLCAPRPSPPPARDASWI